MISAPRVLAQIDCQRTVLGKSSRARLGISRDAALEHRLRLGGNRAEWALGLWAAKVVQSHPTLEASWSTRAAWWLSHHKNVHQVTRNHSRQKLNNHNTDYTEEYAKPPTDKQRIISYNINQYHTIRQKKSNVRFIIVQMVSSIRPQLFRRADAACARSVPFLGNGLVPPMQEVGLRTTQKKLWARLHCFRGITNHSDRVATLQNIGETCWNHSL